MKKQNPAVPLVLYALTVLLLAACFDPLGATPEQEAAGANTGRVVISIAGPDVSSAETASANARTLRPEFSADNYTVTITKGWAATPVFTRENITDLSEPVTADLEAGDHTVVVEAKNSNTVVARGGETFTINLGEECQVVAPIFFLEGGTGTLNYAVTVPPELALQLGSLVLAPLSGGADIVIDDLPALRSGDKTLNSGYYRISPVLYSLIDGEWKRSAKTEILHVFEGLETQAVYNFAAEDFSVATIEDSETLTAALDAIKVSTDEEFALLISASFSSPPHALTDTGYNGKTITLRGVDGDEEISPSSQGSLFTIGAYSAEPVFKLRDITLKGRTDNNAALLHLIKGELIMESGAAVTGNNTRGVTVTAGSFTMRDNASVSGNTFWGYGGGVYVSSNGNFTMRDNALVYGNTATYGGGVCVDYGSFSMEGNALVSGNTATNNSGNAYGGGVYKKGGNFTMQGNASVSGNTVSASSAGRGGGVYVEDGSFTMEGSASVNTNTVSSSGGSADGGGVYIDWGNFTITGNVLVSGNTASSYDSATRGGGVCFIGGPSGGTFAMQGNALISGNRAVLTPPSSTYRAWGGGVFLYTTGTTLTKTGGVIYGSNETEKDSDGKDLKNTAQSQGSAIALGTSSGLTKYRNTTVGPDQNLSTGSNANWTD